ncbi:LPS-assembly lipoprotein [Sphingomonas antarctica]|uniref:LPS assembly lipoprotein LptE n=1 Tax=Sphingomonas antarctica TaxID=2040274 RepID=UPI0039E80BE3
MTRFALLILPIALAGCGLRPLYSDGESGAVANALRQVEVAPIAGKSGYLVRSALIDRLGGAPGGAAKYRLVVTLDDSIQGFGVRRDQAVTRERRTLRSRYQLVDAGTGETVLDATAGSDAGIDIVSSEYATVAAEDTAVERLAETIADQMVARIGLYVTRSAK